MIKSFEQILKENDIRTSNFDTRSNQQILDNYEDEMKRKNISPDVIRFNLQQKQDELDKEHKRELERAQNLTNKHVYNPEDPLGRLSNFADETKRLGLEKLRKENEMRASIGLPPLPLPESKKKIKESKYDYLKNVGLYDDDDDDRDATDDMNLDDEAMYEKIYLEALELYIKFFNEEKHEYRMSITGKFAQLDFKRVYKELHNKYGEEYHRIIWDITMEVYRKAEEILEIKEDE